MNHQPDLFAPPRRQRILVACESSGKIRDHLLDLGHDAVSCDLLPTSAPGPHIQGDVRDVMGQGWDGIIAHPNCDTLTVAAAWCLYHPEDKDLPTHERRPHPNHPNRAAEQDTAAEFFMLFATTPARGLCRWAIIENPVGVMSTRYRKPDISIQPHQLGEDASKRTCFWLEGEMRGKRVEVVNSAPRAAGRWVLDEATGKHRQRFANQTDSGQNRLSPSQDRWQKRAETYLGVAQFIGQIIGPAQ